MSFQISQQVYSVLVGICKCQLVVCAVLNRTLLFSPAFHISSASERPSTTTLTSQSLHQQEMTRCNILVSHQPQCCPVTLGLLNPWHAPVQVTNVRHKNIDTFKWLERCECPRRSMAIQNKYFRSVLAYPREYRRGVALDLTCINCYAT